MSDNDKNTCPVCYTRMRRIKKVLTCPECGYKYCDHSRDLENLFDTSHTHEPNYTTYTNQTTSSQQTNYTPTSVTTEHSAPQTIVKVRGAGKLVKIIIIVYLIIFLCPFICGFLGFIPDLFNELFSQNSGRNKPEVEISSDLIDPVPSVDVDEIINNLDLEDLNVTIPEIPEIPELPEFPESTQTETESFGTFLIKVMFETEYPEYVSKGKYGSISRLEIEKNTDGCYFACYDAGMGNGYVYSDCTYLDPKDLTAFYNLKSLTLYDTEIMPGDLDGLDKLTHFATTATPGEAAQLVNPSTITSLALRLPEGTTDLSGMEQFTSLTSLELDTTYASAEDFSFLNSMSSLTKLSLTGPCIKDLSFLKNMPMLRELSLINTDVSDLSPLTDLDEVMDHLTLNGNVFIEDYTVISKLTNLTLLNLNNCGLEDINFVSKLRWLNMVEVADNNITSLAPLKNTEILYYVNAQNNPLEDLAGLEDVCAY